MAIYLFLGENGPNATGWIEQAIGGNSFPLLARIDIALQQFFDSSDREKAAWGERGSRTSTSSRPWEHFQLSID